MTNATKNAQAWSYTADSAKTYKFATANKYLDRNIEFSVPEGEASVAGSVEVAATADIAVASTATKTAEGKYRFEGSKAITATVTGDASASVTKAGWIADIDDAAITSNVTGTATAAVELDAAAATVTASGDSSVPTIVTETSTAKIGTITTTQPESGYYVAAKASSSAFDVSLTKSVGTKGYLNSTDEITAEDISIEAKESDTYYVPVDAGSVGTSASDPGESYTANTTAVVPTGGYLKIEEGYYPATKISLATLVPDSYENVPFSGVDQMLEGYMAWDKDGAAIVGTMADNGATGTTITEQGGTYSIPAGYTTGGTVTAQLAEGTITNNTTGGTSTATIIAGKQIKIGKGYYADDVYYTAQEEAPTEGIAGSLAATVTEGYEDIVLTTTSPEGPYVTIQGNGSMTEGNIYDGTSTPATRYLSVYAGSVELI